MSQDRAHRAHFECIFEILANGDTDLTFEEILTFCSYVLKAPVKEIYSEARKLLVVFHSAMGTTNGRELLKLMKTPGLYSSPSIDDIGYFVIQLTKYKNMDFSYSSDEENETMKGKGTKAERIMNLWAQVERQIIDLFFQKLDLKPIQSYNLVYQDMKETQMFADLVKHICEVHFLFKKKNIGDQIKQLISVFQGVSEMRIMDEGLNKEPSVEHISI